MTALRLWLRRSSGFLALPAIVGLVAVVIAGRSGWYYEWDRAMSWASASTILLGPLVAGLLAFDVARRLGPTLEVLIATTRRGLNGVFALALAVWAFGAGGWLLGIGYAAPLALKLPRPQAIAISMEIGIHNGTLAIFIGLNVLGSAVMSIPAAVYSLLMFFTAAGAAWWAARGNPAAASAAAVDRA